MLNSLLDRFHSQRAAGERAIPAEAGELTHDFRLPAEV